MVTRFSDEELVEISERYSAVIANPDNASGDEVAKRIMEVIGRLTGADLGRLLQIIEWKLAINKSMRDGLDAVQAKTAALIAKGPGKAEESRMATVRKRPRASKQKG